MRTLEFGQRPSSCLRPSCSPPASVGREVENAERRGYCRIAFSETPPLRCQTLNARSVHVGRLSKTHPHGGKR